MKPPRPTIPVCSHQQQASPEAGDFHHHSGEHGEGNGMLQNKIPRHILVHVASVTNLGTNELKQNATD
jgi:hypothetical protein